MYLNNRLPANLQSLQRLRILVVDSSDDYCYMITVLLQLYGMEVLTASSAQQALKIFIKWQPDILVSEIALPNDDSCTLIRQVRTKAGEHGKMVTAIALTDYNNQNDLCDGFDMQFSKPLNLDEFVTKLVCLAICYCSI
ncbi:MAG: response regulator [Rhizonema sp. NSF051]|nr:response regulator [Rhizonema sp. NSF051]